MEHKKNWGPGYTFYRCDECGHEWREKSRHCESQSTSICPRQMNQECDSMYGARPTGYEKHYEWETDESGNLKQ